MCLDGDDSIIFSWSEEDKKKLTFDSSRILQQCLCDRIVSLEGVSMFVNVSSINIYLDARKKGKVNTAKWTLS